MPRILWLGMDDSKGCVLHWHDLRCRLRDEHGVTLAGPGYSWEFGQKHAISEFGDDWDWIVLDDCNAMGYVPIMWDVRPKCPIAWREHDWHNVRRQQNAAIFMPDLVLSCYEREMPITDIFRDHPNRHFVPHPVSTKRFNPGNGQERTWDAGLYGTLGAGYEDRRVARASIVSLGERAWLPVHGGYWRDDRGSGEKTRYNDELARDLRRVKCLWVNGGKWNGIVMKYFEGAASGCLLVGTKPDGWDLCFPPNSMVECEPEKAAEVMQDFADDEIARRYVSEHATEHCLKEHSVEARARQIMEILR